MSNRPMPGEVYKHFKGNIYRIVTLAKHSETGEELVIYQALYGDYQVYARPLAMFLELVDKNKYPDVAQEYRFEKQQESEEETIEIDPLVLEFLDAGSYEERLNILAALHHRITDQMITTMALAVDVEIEDGDVEERYEELKSCLLTYEKYECNRLR